MKEQLLALANSIFETLKNNVENYQRSLVVGYSENGDAQFSIDTIAELHIRDFIKKHKLNIALKTEDGTCEIFGKNPKYLFVIDPIDGSRSAAAGLEMANISIAVAPYKPDVTIGDVEYSLIMEIKSGAWLYAEKCRETIEYNLYPYPLPRLSQNTDLKKLFWSLEFNGHPSKLMIDAYGHLIDQSANNGGVFVFNSASYSITRIITGQLDAYVDIGNRILKDHPHLLLNFQAVGNGKVLHLFPYDIAAAVLIAKKSGIIITDAYGNDLEKTNLLDCSYHNQQSCIAAANTTLHQKILSTINWNAIQN